MLYDLLLVPNISTEFYLGRNWTLEAGWAYNWIKNDNSHVYWRLYGGGLELRKWFGRSSQVKPFQGHHIGIYANVGTYDFEFGSTGNLSYLSYAAGLSYGYSLPIARRFNIDFEIGLGYFGGDYKEYIPIDHCYVWQADKRRHYIGPTKAEVSLVWLIGRGNVNKDKGGRK